MEIISALLSLSDSLDAYVSATPSRYRRPVLKSSTKVNIGTEIPVVHETLQPYTRIQRLKQLMPLSPRRSRALLEAGAVLKQQTQNVLHELGIEKIDTTSIASFDPRYCTAEPPELPGYVDVKKRKVLRPAYVSKV